MSAYVETTVGGGRGRGAALVERQAVQHFPFAPGLHHSERAVHVQEEQLAVGADRRRRHAANVDERPQPDISTWQRIGHFYLALTEGKKLLVTPMAKRVPSGGRRSKSEIPTNMNDSMRIARGTLLLALLMICFPRPLAAYLDPGSGSYLLQVLVAGLLGASFAVKRFWGEHQGLFSGL